MRAVAKPNDPETASKHRKMTSLRIFPQLIGKKKKKEEDKIKQIVARPCNDNYEENKRRDWNESREGEYLCWE